MATIGRLWAGRVFGTNTGNLFVELETTADELRGTLRFMDNLLGGWNLDPHLLPRGGL